MLICALLRPPFYESLIMKKFILAIILVLSLSLTALPAFADSPADITYTVNSSNYTTDYYLCNNSASCSGYNYLIVDWPSAQASQYFNFSLSTGSLRVTSNQITTQFIYYLDNVTTVKFSGSSGTLASYFGGSGVPDIQIKLSASQGCPSCPTPEPCPDPVEAPYFVQLVIDAFWKYHIYFAGVLVSIIVLIIVFKFIRKAIK